MATVQQERPPVLFRMSSDQFCELPTSDRFKLELLDGEVVVAAKNSRWPAAPMVTW